MAILFSLYRYVFSYWGYDPPWGGAVDNISFACVPGVICLFTSPVVGGVFSGVYLK